MTVAPSGRSRVRRLADRGAYDRETIDSIIDEALVSHVGFVHEGHPIVIPMIHGRSGNDLYLHGSPGSRLLRAMKSGGPVSVSITLIDGLVVARAAFHNSLNYRSVVLFGVPRGVDQPEEKEAALRVITDQVLPGRWAESRPMAAKELRASQVVAVPIDEASAKVRSGPPLDEEADYELPIWAGVIPLETVARAPEPDPRLGSETHMAASVAAYASQRRV